MFGTAFALVFLTFLWHVAKFSIRVVQEAPLWFKCFYVCMAIVYVMGNMLGFMADQLGLTGIVALSAMLATYAMKEN